MKRRLLASILSLVMAISLLPTAAMAANGEQQGLTATAADTLPKEGQTTEITLSGGPKGTTETVRISGYNAPWYVTDGLVLQYDGIYNTGEVGEHEENANTWTPLVSTVGDNTGINLSSVVNSNEGWVHDDNGLYLKESNAGDTKISPAFTASNGFTWDYSFKLDSDYSNWTKNYDYSAPIQLIGPGNVGTFSRGNFSAANETRILFYPSYRADAEEKGQELVASGKNFYATDFAQITTAVGESGKSARKVYLDGNLVGESSKANTYEYSFSNVRLYPMNVSEKSAEDGVGFSLGHTIYGARLYNRELDANEIAQNAAVDELRYKDGKAYIGSANDQNLLERFDGNGNAYTDISVRFDGKGEATISLVLNRAGENDLTFTVGGKSADLTLNVLTEDDKDAVNVVNEAIDAIPDNIAEADLNEALSKVAAAQKAYDELDADLQKFISADRKTKLNNAASEIDTAAAGKHTVTVAYKPNGGSVSSESTTVIYKETDEDNSHKTFTLAVPTRKNYTFEGWMLNGNRITDANGDSNDWWDTLSDAEVVAQWKPNIEANTALEITEADDIYALARIFDGTGKDADYQRFGYDAASTDAKNKLMDAATVYELKNDIELTDSSFCGIPHFKGTFDGRNKTIEVELKLANATWSTGTQFGCLFASMDGGVVKDVTFTGSLTMADDAEITVTSGLQDVAVVAGRINDSDAVLQNVTTNVKVNLKFATTMAGPCVYVGAFVGRALNASGGLTDCVNNGNLTAIFTGFTANGGCRLGGVVGHPYAGVTFTRCENYGDIDTTGSNTRTRTGGLFGSSSSNLCTDCVLGGSVNGGDYAARSYCDLDSASSGNILLAKVTGTAGQTIAYSGDASQTVTLTGENTTATFRISVEVKDGLIENDAFSYAQYLTVDGVRLDWFSLDNTKLTLNLKSEAAAALDVSFQTASSALILKTETDLLNLQKALNEGDHDAIAAIYALGGKTVTSDSMAIAALETAYYKLGNDITVKDSEFVGIGVDGASFSGHFDGQDYTVTLQNNPTIADAYGLFGYVNTGANGVPVIENLNVVADTAVKLSNSTAYVGALAGVLYHGELKNVKATVTKLTVSGTAGEKNALHLGSLIGNGFPDSVSNVSAEINGPLTASVWAENIYMGGGFGSCVLPGPVTVTYNSGAQLSAENTKVAANSNGAIRIGGLIGYNASGSMDLRGSKLINKADSALEITAKCDGSVFAGGWVGYLTNATTTADMWLYVDETTVMDGKFAVVTNECTNNSAFSGGIVGATNTSFSVSIKNYLNTVTVNGSKYVGGLIGRSANSGTNKLISIENSANGGTLTGTTIGGLIGSAEVTEMAFNDALYVKTNTVTKGIGNQSTDADGIIALDATKLTDGTFDTEVENVLSATAPAALTVSGNAKLDGTSLIYTKVGEQKITFLWNGKELYSTTVNVTPKTLTSNDVTITGVNSTYTSDDAAAKAEIDVIYNGVKLVEGTDYTVTQDNHKFTINFKGNYTGSAEKTYEVEPDALVVTAADYNGTYDGKEHSIAVAAPADATVTYGESAGTYDKDSIAKTNAGTYVIYWKATKGEQTVTGSAVISIAKATLTIKANNKSMTVGGMIPEFTYTSSGLVGEETLTTEPKLACSADGSVAGTYDIVPSGADAGNNYEITYVNGTLTVSRRHSSSSSTVTPTPEPTPDDRTGFVDVPANAYFADAVEWAVNKGITNGLSDTMFGPYESCTRAQIVTFLWRAAGSPEPKAVSSFTDVPASAYYAKAVAWAVENGITNGMTETTFAPNETCTRGQSVTFLYRALKGTASGSANFTDVNSDAFYADAVNWAVANNVTNGTSATTFSPNADCTRAEIVTFLYRAYQGK